MLCISVFDMIGSTAYGEFPTIVRTYLGDSYTQQQS